MGVCVYVCVMVMVGRGCAALTDIGLVHLHPHPEGGVDSVRHPRLPQLLIPLPAYLEGRREVRVQAADVVLYSGSSQKGGDDIQY